MLWGTGNIARKALLEAGLCNEVPGVTVDRQCGSGLESIIYACRMVQCGAGRVYVAGGVESTSRAPWKIKRPQSVYETQLPQFYERASFAPEGQDPSMIEVLRMWRSTIVCRERTKMRLRFAVIS